MAEILTGESPFKEEAQRLIEETGAVESANEILGPFSDIAASITEALWDSFLPSSQTNSLHWPYLVLTLIIAVIFYYMRNGRGAKDADGLERQHGLLGYLLPRGIYTHLSARVDIGLYLIDRSLMPIWVVLFLGAVSPTVEKVVIGSLQWLFGSSPALQPNLFWMLLYGFVILLVADMIFFFIHLMMHRTRIGWAIHKVHHSAEVLTPLTRYREHFLAGPLWASGFALGLTIPAAIFAYLFNGGITQITIMNVGIFSFLYALNGNFRHYHVSFRYPRWLEYWIQSPGMHHTHHSILEKHWDSNLGLVTSIWDRIFGTLYIPEPNEDTPWGLVAEDQAKYTTLRQNLVTPFREVFAILRGRSKQDSNY
jgi:sterol desaturase/sphingolipid hydroxylase (fatty acid hydroxylase superfamily)